MQTKAGGEKLRQTMIKKFGSVEAWKEHMRRSAAKGGSASQNGGFASNKKDKDGLTGKQRAQRFGKIGGKISRRGKAKSW